MKLLIILTIVLSFLSLSQATKKDIFKFKAKGKGLSNLTPAPPPAPTTAAPEYKAYDAKAPDTKYIPVYIPIALVAQPAPSPSYARNDEVYFPEGSPMNNYGGINYGEQQQQQQQQQQPMYGIY